jgi:hypothetical protein
MYKICEECKSCIYADIVKSLIDGVEYIYCKIDNHACVDKCINYKNRNNDE